MIQVLNRLGVTYTGTSGIYDHMRHWAILKIIYNNGNYANILLKNILTKATGVLVDKYNNFQMVVYFP